MSSDRSKAVVCVETGHVYPSIKAAARAAYVAKAVMQRAIRNGWAANSCHWQFVKATDCNDSPAS
jgi:hypothetical protein